MPTLPLLACLVASVPAQDSGEVPIEVRFQLRLPDGSPAEGAEVVLTGTPPDEAGRRTLGRAALVRVDPAFADHEGRCTLKAAGLAGTRWRATLRHPEHPGISLRWNEVPESGVLDAGTVAFEPACWIRGVILDQEGELMVEGWTVSAIRQGGDGLQSMPSFLRVSPDPATGQFLVGPLPPGRIQLGARHDNGMRLADTHVEVQAGEVASCSLIYEGPDLRGRIGVDVKGGRFSSFTTFRSGLRFVLLNAAGEELQTAQQVPRRPWDQFFEGVSPGEYAIELRSELFRPVRVEPALPGVTYSVTCVPNAALQLQVLDDQGQPLDRWGLDVSYTDVNFYPNTFEVQSLSGARPSGPIQGLVPGNVLLTLRLPGGAELRRLATLTPDGVEAVEWTVFAPGDLALQVLDHEGLPLEGIEIRLTMRLDEGSASRRARTDADGRALLQELPAAPSRVALERDGVALARWSGTLGARRTTLVELRLPAFGSLEVHAQLPESIDVESTGLKLTRLADPVTWRPGQPQEVSLGVLPLMKTAPTRLRSVPAGAVRVALVPIYKGEILFARPNSWVAPASGRAMLELAADTQRRVDLDGRGAVAAGTVRIQGEGDHEVVFELLENTGIFRASPRRAIAPSGTRVSWIRAGSKVQLAAGSYRAFLLDRDGRWVHPVGTLNVRPDGDHEMTLGVTLHTGVLRVVDAEGQPRAGYEVLWETGGKRLDGCRGRTNAEGLLELTLPVGRHMLIPAEADGWEAAAFFEWNAGAEGPQDVTLK